MQNGCLSWPNSRVAGCHRHATRLACSGLQQRTTFVCRQKLKYSQRPLVASDVTSRNSVNCTPFGEPAKCSSRKCRTIRVAAGTTAAEGTQDASGFLGVVKRTCVEQFRKLDGLWGKFIPMVALFFFMAFVNTILDSLKDSLVITAVGGGTEVIPFLTVYAVLPSSLLFLVLFSYATQRFSRAALFNIIVCSFLAFYGCFALLYPSHEALHFHGTAETVLAKLPNGLAGGVGMIRNWLFTLFYCVSELWGDVVLSLLFWGLANETTSLRDAPLLYPLFGVGANVAQTLAGMVLTLFSSSTSGASYAVRLQAIMAMVMVFGGIILGLHAFITNSYPKHLPADVAAVPQAVPSPAGQAAEPVASGGNGAHSMPHSSETAERLSSSLTAGSTQPSSSRRTQASENRRSNNRAGSQAKSKLSLRQALAYLVKSPQIRCLALMALAQGISTNLIEIAWKAHLHMLHPTPGAYAAFMGDVAFWTGIVTGLLMFASPILFDKFGWRMVAGITPRFMVWSGLPFFVGCVLFAWASSGALPVVAALRVLVVVGAILQIFARGAKFSMFKPAEEMVYIGLDEESRSKGKAAIDVVGAQTGKAVGSALQQVLLLFSGGVLSGTLPFMAVAYFFILRSWNGAVNELSVYYDEARLHEADDPHHIGPHEQVGAHGDADGFLTDFPGSNGKSGGGVLSVHSA